MNNGKNTVGLVNEALINIAYSQSNKQLLYYKVHLKNLLTPFYPLISKTLSLKA